jgi:hypothetical protein
LNYDLRFLLYICPPKLRFWYTENKKNTTFFAENNEIWFRRENSSVSSSKRFCFLQSYLKSCTPKEDSSPIRWYRLYAYDSRLDTLATSSVVVLDNFTAAPLCNTARGGAVDSGTAYQAETSWVRFPVVSLRPQYGAGR